MLPSSGGAGRGPGKAERGAHPARRSARAGDPRPPSPSRARRAPTTQGPPTTEEGGGRRRGPAGPSERQSRAAEAGTAARTPRSRRPTRRGTGRRPTRAAPGAARQSEALLRPARGPGPPERAGESERPTRARAQQPRRGRRPTSAAEQRRAEALERSEKPSGRSEGSLPQSRAASLGERGRGRVPEAHQVLEERSRRKRLWRSQCRAAERLSGGRPPGPSVASVPTRYMDVISSRC